MRRITLLCTAFFQGCLKSVPARVYRDTGRQTLATTYYVALGGKGPLTFARPLEAAEKRDHPTKGKVIRVVRRSPAHVPPCTKVLQLNKNNSKTELLS